MDYRLAHTTSALVDERYVVKPAYQSFDDINALRSKLSFTLSDSQKNAEIENKKILDEKEQRRIEKLKREDLRHEKRFNEIANRAF